MNKDRLATTVVFTVFLMVWGLIYADIVRTEVADAANIPLPIQPQVHGSIPARMNIQLEVDTHQQGIFTHYKNWGGYPWRNDKPDWEPFGKPTATHPGRPIIAEYKGDPVPKPMYFDGTNFISSNGSRWGVPARWYYHRPAEEIWDGTKFVMPDGTPTNDTKLVTLRADDLQGGIDFYMARFTVPAIQDAMDKSKEFFPKSGAPE